MAALLSKARIATMASLAVLVAGAASAGAAVQGERPEVAATIFPIYDIVRQVAGPAADVVLMLPPGASPHTFEPTPGVVRAISGARVVFVVGHGLDDWAAALALGAGAPRVVRVGAGVALRRTGGHDPGDARATARGTVDPHYWLAPANGRAIARTVAGELERLVPERRDELRGRLAAFLERLDAVDAEIRREMADLPVRRIATVHDAFGYFAEAYGLEVAAVFEPFPGAEPSPRLVQEFQQKVRAAGVKVLFTEPQLSVEALRPIARDLGVTLAVLDPLGGMPGREGYLELLRFNAAQIAAAARGLMR